jgi:hypothetical protein
VQNDTEKSRVLDLVKHFVESEKAVYPIVEAYLFGSWAYGSPGTVISMWESSSMARLDLPWNQLRMRE